MTQREIYTQSLLFQKPEKIYFQPGGPRESTLHRWYEEGLSKDRPFFQQLCHEIGICLPVHKPMVDPGVSFKMIPQFEEKVLAHENGHYIVQDWMGAITEISDQYDYTYIRTAKDFVTRKWHRFPIESHKDWEQMKTRYQPDTKGRFPDDFEERCRVLQDRDYPVSVAFNGPFWQLREWCGLEGSCILMIEQPEWVGEMIEFWTSFVSRILDRMLVNFCPDRVLIQEDMAYKEHSMISPRMVQRFLMPAYQAWIPRLKRKGCSIIEMDSDGYIGELIPLWIEAGFNCCSPIEVAAGNDILKYRSIYGKKMAFSGGIDKRSIAAGGNDMERELMRVVPPLLEDGGYIPGCDHGVPPDISWPGFVEYSRLLAHLTGWLK